MWMSTLLLTLGLVLIVRFGLQRRLISALTKHPRTSVLIPLGLSAGFIDASGGGGWGPVTTPTLLTITSHEPKRVIGTVSASEFFVALAASGGFIAGSATSAMDWKVIAGLLLGGVLMAPFAALLAGKLPHAPFGTLIGGVVVIINGRILLNGFNIATSTTTIILATTAVVVLSISFRAWRREDRDGVEHSFFEEGGN